MTIELEDLVARIRLDTAGVGASLGQVQSALAKAGGQMQATGRTATTHLSAPLIGVGVIAANLAADFDATMRQVAISTGGPTKALSDLAKQMGAETAFSAKDAADAMLELAKGGMTAAQIEGGALEATMTAAAAGGISLAEASTAVANAVATFGLKAKDAGQVAVALAGAANASSASMSSLQQGLQAVGGVAKSSGLSLQDTVGTLSAFDAVGLKGSDAGTSLKAMLNSLIPTTEKASGTMKRLGLDFVKPNGEFVSMTGIAKQLKGALGGASESTRSLALETIFGADGQRAANALVEAGEGGLRKYIKATRDQETTQKLANAAMEGTAGAIERAKGSMETAALTLGETLAPYVEDAAHKIEELANQFSALDPETRKTIVQIVALVAAVGPSLIVLGGLTRAVGSVAGAMKTVSTAVSGFTGPLPEGTTRLSKFAGAAKQAAGVGGMIALADGLRRAKTEGTSFTSVMEGAAGGAGIGAMFGPIGALVGAGAGAGLSALVGSFHKTAAEAEAARIEMMKTEGFKQAQDDAATLTKALQGVVDAYGKVPRAAIEASFTGGDGKLDADIQKLRDLGVSMDTIVSATLGRADAQQVVDRALSNTIAKEQAAQDQAKAGLDAATAAVDRAIKAQSSRTVATKAQLEATQRAQDAEAKAKATYEATKKPLAELAALQGTFGERIRRNTDAITAHQRQVGELAAKLGLTREQYLRLPKDVRTKVEADGLPQTLDDAIRLIGEYKGLQSFKNIRAVVEATGAKLSIEQVKELARRYDLTPKQAKTLIQATNVENEGAKVRAYHGDLNAIPPRVNTEVHTSYTYSGLKSPTRGRDDLPDTRGRQAAGTDKGPSIPGLVRGVDELGDRVKDRLSGLSDEVKRILDKAFDGKALDRHIKAVTKGMSEEVGQVRKTAKAYDGLVRQYNAAKEAGQAAADEINGRLETARATVTRLKDELAAFAASVQANVVDFGSVVGLGTRQNGGEEVAATTETLLEDLRARLVKVRQYVATIKALVAQGLNETTIRQLLAAGVEGGLSTAEAIAQGGSGAITEINDLTAQITAEGASLGELTANQFYGNGVAAAVAVADGIAAEAERSRIATETLLLGIQAEMERTGTRLQRQMVKVGDAAVDGLVEGMDKGDKAKQAARKLARLIKDEVKDALGIKSPSRVMMGLGEFTGEGLALGLDASRRQVAAAAVRMADAAVVAPPSMSGVVGGLNTSAPEIRVFIGDRELTDIVDVQIGSTLAPLTTLVRQGA